MVTHHQECVSVSSTHPWPCRCLTVWISSVWRTRKGTLTPSAEVNPSASQARITWPPSFQVWGFIWEKSPLASWKRSRFSSLSTVITCLPWSVQKFKKGASKYRASVRIKSKNRPYGFKTRSNRRRAAATSSSPGRIISTSNGMAIGESHQMKDDAPMIILDHLLSLNLNLTLTTRRTTTPPRGKKTHARPEPLPGNGQPLRSALFRPT